jgi:signal transduction histidine kinase
VADGVKLERVVENLVDNARKFTPSGGRIAVRALGGNGDGRALLEVANTSEEMDPEAVEQLFDRFYRRDRSRSGRSGSGLGLAIARDLAALQGGTLDALWHDGMLVFSLALPVDPGSISPN